jgi:hypothetical protein
MKVEPIITHNDDVHLQPIDLGDIR